MRWIMVNSQVPGARLRDVRGFIGELYAHDLHAKLRTIHSVSDLSAQVAVSSDTGNWVLPHFPCCHCLFKNRKCLISFCDPAACLFPLRPRP